jgi:uridylate kinase
MWVLKIGGSILHAASHDGSGDGACDAFADARGALLEALTRQPGRFLLVPGGGRHADAVRSAQREQGFDDDAAHVLALAAMDLCAAELAALLGGTARVITRLADAPATVATGFTPVWAPHTELAGDHTLPRNWGLTSDSIAAVAARRLGLDGVCLLKSCTVPEGASPQQLAAAGVVDAEWPRQIEGLRARVVAPTGWATSAAVLGPPA